MASQTGGVDRWSKNCEEEDVNGGGGEKEEVRVGVVYRRKTLKQTSQGVQLIEAVGGRKAMSGRRISLMHRSLSTRGRTSITLSVEQKNREQLRRQDPKKKPRRPAANKRSIQPPQDFVTERVAYFQEVDSFDLVQESPSPRNIGHWVQDCGKAPIALQDLKSITHPALRKWLRTLPVSFDSPSLTDIQESLPRPKLCRTDVEESEKSSFFSDMAILHLGSNSTSLDYECVGETNGSLPECVIRDSSGGIQISEKGSAAQSQVVRKSMELNGEALEMAIKRLSLTDPTSSAGEHVNAYIKLLKLCGQSSLSTLSEAFSEYCDTTSISKIGEGTYGEAFKGGGCVFKIVPIDGDFLVNGEVQKRAAELFEEVLLSLALNNLRGKTGDDATENTCRSFIETKGIRVCQGAYDEFLINAWEDWDAKHCSENEHPKVFPKQQCYVVFILEDGGKDLESFVLANFNEACSLFIQVTAALAVAEVACEFEHRDLHWGNILLSRTSAETAEFVLQRKKLHAKTFGLSISIIDFTLSRINDANTILFMDLSSDPAIFEGPKGDSQSETYRKMLEVTDGCWDGSFPKTNVLWLQYLVDILLSKKTFKPTAKDSRELRSLKKRLLSCNSAQEALNDEFFTPLWIEDAS